MGVYDGTDSKKNSISKTTSNEVMSGWYERVVIETDKAGNIKEQEKVDEKVESATDEGGNKNEHEMGDGQVFSKLWAVHWDSLEADILFDCVQKGWCISLSQRMSVHFELAIKLLMHINK